METRHRVEIGDARSLDEVATDGVHLVVTSPPYPMIELWDELFVDLDAEIGTDLANGDGRAAFERMHATLDPVWEELARVLVDGGIACINVGDATRRLDDGFRRYANHARITQGCEEAGLVPLPTIHWHKPTNAATKFMGSGMLPPNAYATQEHEQILVFRNGDELRSFEPGDPDRYAAAYFWEERNRWFSDRWDDVAGRRQERDDGPGRDRAAAFPVDIPYRLICMYSIYGDTVLDPFWGTGTSTVAAMAAGRNSIGVERDASFVEAFPERLEGVEDVADALVRERLERHRAFVANGGDLGYRASALDAPVRTSQETDVRLRTVEGVERTGDVAYRATHEPVDR